MPAPWEVWIDTGGTFTDCLARDPGGRLLRAKVLSSSRLRGRVGTADRSHLTSPLVSGLPTDFLRGYGFRPLGDEGRTVPVTGSDPATGELELAEKLPAAPHENDPFELISPEEAPLLATRLVTGCRLDDELPPVRMRLATTRGTNALLERRGAATALFISRGFADLLRIGNQQRPDLFAQRIVKPEPLYAAVVEVEGRLDAVGEEVRPLDLEPLAGRARELVERGVDCAAVALLNSYRQPRHERLTAACLRQAGFRHVSCSAELAPFIRIVPRAETAVVNVYLAEVIDDYRERLRRPLGGGSLHLMTSAGGLVRASEFHAKDSLLSGPAGGVVGAAAAGRRSGLKRVIVFDMGGTSTDVSRHEEQMVYSFETRVGSARLLAPALAIETVAAGGGSICSLTRGRLRVGPRSAGARPGPACYGAGGPFTLTDVNLLLGRLEPAYLGIPIVPSAAERAAGQLARELVGEGGGEVDQETLLAGCLQIANETMAQAVHRISIREGHDPGEYALVAFGGAGPQHACGLAELLGIDRCLVPADAGLLSAHGLGAASIERFAARQVLRPLLEVADKVPVWLERLEAEAVGRLGRDGVEPATVEIRRRPAELRLAGQDSTLLVEAGASAALEDEFAVAYEGRFGYPPPDRPLELVSLRVVASSPRPAVAAAEQEHPTPAPVSRARRAWFGGAWRRVPVFERSRMVSGQTFAGPALVLEEHSTTVVEPEWHGRVDAAGALLLRRRPEASGEAVR
ncbi:MAG: hydantoinase/oxoprolinase family protein [Thermoanaerobaculia bacterium]